MFSIQLDSTGLCIVDGSKKADKIIQKKVKEIKKTYNETRTLAIKRLSYTLFLENADFDHYTCMNTFNNRGLTGVELVLTFDDPFKLQELLTDLLD